ncbi:MAG: GNAT family N-acetyltransferase [Chitinivorax sp.]
MNHSIGNATDHAACDTQDLAVELAQWQPAAGNDGGFFGTACFHAWCSAFLPQENWQQEAHLLSVRRQNQPLCQAVFGVQRFPGFSALSLGGYYWPYRSLAQTGSSLQLATAIAARLKAQHWPVIRFGPVRAGDPLIEAVLDRLRAQGWACLEKPLGTSWLVAVPENAAAFEAQWGKHLTDRVAYYTRRLNKSAPVHIVCAPPATTAEWQRRCDDCATIEANSWVAKSGGDTKFVGERNRQFWRSLLDASGQPPFQLCLLYVGERPVAFSLNLDLGDTRHIVANTYDEEFKSNSPGTILTAHVLKDTLQHGIRHVDWGAGDSGYKQRWGATEGVQLLDRLAIRPGLRGMALRYLLRKRGGYG